MPKVISGLWSLPPEDENQWEVYLGELRLTVNAQSHQEAKKAALEYWSSCCSNQEKAMESLKERVKEKWRGGLHAKLRHRKVSC